MKVNMTPNPLDVVTIHASQGDTEARQWEFELHNNGELIDTSDVTEQMFFKAYKGGTEQLLPENTSTPTTSPFIGDIRYPQGLLTDQEFTCRESPTESDGLAKITDIKGNTLVWNQLVQNGNFADTSNWRTEYSATISASNNVLSLTPTAQNGRVSQNFIYTANHKLLIMADVKLSSTSGQFDYVTLSAYAIDNRAQVSTQRPIASTNWQKLYVFCYSTSSNANNRFMFTDGRTSDWGTTQIRNFMAFDLTSMFGEAKANELFASEQSQVGKGLLEFTSLFPLSYYSYNQGSLLSFNGNGIKTVSKNQFNTQVVTTSYQGLTLTKTQGTIRAVYSGGSQFAGFNFYGSPVFTDTFLKGKYRLSFDAKGLDTQWTVGLRQGASFLGGGQALAISNDGHYSFTIDAEANPNCYLSFARTGNKTTAYDVTFSNIQLELGTTETSYTQYEEKTISLPISQYFPDGMKSAGNVYDEWTPSKASPRVGTVTLNGTEIWNAPDSSGNCWMDFHDMKISTDYTQTMTATVTVVKNRRSMVSNSVTGYDQGTLNYLYFRTADATQSIENVKTYLQANPVTVNYELKTSTETSFSTASLVTENAEIPLSNEDGVLIGKCTEELSAEPGFHDAKIKLSDSDGECYSNKLQLHVERKPS